MTRSQEFIEKYKRVLETGPDYYNVDSAYMKLSEFAKRKKKFLLIFPTPALTKAVSATVNVINDMFCSEMPDWAFDVAYLPTKKDIELYDKCNMPYAIGEISHLDASHFDMVGFSVAVLHEVLTVPVIMKSFQRCDKPIPLTWTERKDLPLGEVPIFMCGGITASHGDIMFGELGDGRQAYLDMMCLGICDSTKWVCQDLLTTEASTNQEFIEECLKYPSTYHPQAYKVVYKDNLIVENTKINPKAPDFVHPYYPKFIPNRLGVGRTIIRSFGSNAGDTQIQLSESCTGGRGTCNFCAEGNYSGAWQEDSIENIKKHALETKKWTAAVSCKPLSFNCNHMKDFTNLIYVLNETFPKVTYINMRLEELAQDTEAISMMRYTGASRLSAPIEGLSERIRNGFLNKNLSTESIEKLLHFMVGQRVTDIKVGLVWTGFENEEDWKEMRGLVSRLKSEAASLNRKLPFRLKACLTKEALTPIPGKGLVRQDKLSIGPVVGWCRDKIIETQPQGESEVWEVVTTLGQVIRGTKNHPLLTKWNGKRAYDNCYTAISDLKEGQWLYGRIATNIYGYYQNLKLEASRQEPARDLVIDENLAALFGWYMGDGFIESEGMKTFGCVFSDQEKFLSTKLSKVVEDLGYKVHNHDQGDKKCVGWRVHTASFTRALNREFGHSAYGKKVSDLILQSPKSVQVEFLKYWFTADGTAVLQKGYNSRVRLYSVSKQVLSDAQVMLMNMGILSVVSGHKVKCGEKEFYTYQLEVRSCSISDFKEIVGFVGPKQDKVLVVNTRSSHCLKSNGFYRCKVKSVKRIPNAETYGVQVAETSSYVTNGIVSHNTALVYYPGTPLEIAERVTSRISYEGKRYFSDEMYEKNKEAGIHIKINGFRGSTFIEQAVVDLGGSITHWVQKYLVEPGIVCYNMRPIADPERFPSFKKLITSPDKYFAARKVDSYISPFHRIRLSLEGGIYSAQRKLEKDWFDKEPTGKCLYTYEGCKTKCFKNGIKNKPFIHYADVKSVDGHLIGTNPEKIEGCNYCETPQEMKEYHLKRDWRHKYKVSDLQAQVVTRTQIKYRFLLRRSKDYALLNPHYTAFSSIACLLRQSASLLQKYWNLVDHSLYNQMDPELVYEIAGYQVVDAVFKGECLEEIKEAISKANKELQASQFVQVTQIPMDEKLSVSDYNVYHFISKNVSLETYINGKATYKGNVRVLSNVDMQAKVTQQQDKSLVYPFFKRTKNGVEGYFALPRRYNPFLFFQEVLSEKKYTQKAIQQNVRFDIVMPLQVNSYAHCKCGSPVAVSTITGKTLQLCPNCIAKTLTSKL